MTSRDLSQQSGCARHGRPDCDECFMEATLTHDNYIDALQHERDAARHEVDRLLAEERRLREALRQTVDLCNAMREYAPTLNLAAEKQLRESLGLLDA